MELHWFVYKNVASRMLNTDAMVSKMSGVKWDQKEISTSHSPFVDSLVQDMTVLNGRLLSLGDKRVPKKALQTLWNELLLILNRVFIEGYVSRCGCLMFPVGWLMLGPCLVDV